ncbi:MAG: zinc-dependent metalloprotease [Kibdelosporangium sp.]
MDWSLAISTGQRLVRRGPEVPMAEAENAVRELRVATDVAEGHVRELTGLGLGLPLPPGEVVDRPGWIKAAAEGLEVLTEGALPRSYAGPVGAVMAGSAGVQAGMVLAFLGARVLGQYDPFNDGRLLLVAPNIIGAQRALDVPASDFRMWVCLHECTHRLQFTAVPWLKEYFSGQVTKFLSGMDDSAASALNRLPDVIKEARRRSLGSTSSGGPVALMELLQSAEQREVFDRLIALSTLLEGHADFVMDAVGPTVVPTVDVIRERFTERRRGGGLMDRVLRTLLGVDAKVKQYAAGAAFTRHVVGEAGMAGFNEVWTSPETLPRRSEITDPDAWLRRVRP